MSISQKNLSTRNKYKNYRVQKLNTKNENFKEVPILLIWYTESNFEVLIFKRYAIFMESLTATFSEQKGWSIMAKVLGKDIN